MAFEERARSQGYQRIAGIDEAGRGPLAGPVVAAACMIPDNCYLPGINDSKKLTEQERERLYQMIRENPEILSGVGIVEAVIIDQINILQATFQAMAAAILQLQQRPDYILFDGNQFSKSMHLEFVCEGIVKGDSLSLSVMAAGILAKVTRDRIMHEHHKTWPGYGFDEHKGYGTEKHMKNLKELGPCPIHRMSYEPVKLAVVA
jgi:ribonuclease HII